MRGRAMREKEKFDISLWQPRTSLGRMVKEGKIKSISEIMKLGKRILEPEIVDALVPNLEEDLLGVSMVHRMHKSGRRTKFRVIAVVGNRDGVVGVAHTSAKEVGPSIRKAVLEAKLNAIEVARGCGSWECACDRPHSVPFEAVGKGGSVYVTLKPAPRGLGIVAAEVPKIVLRLAGIKDVWTGARGQTRTSINLAEATFDALKQTVRTALREPVAGRIKIGPVGGESG